jgi:nucleotide-binding universal stress UspA family protein
MSMTADTQPNDDVDLPIVVGIDGSECSLTALRWADGQARLTSRPLRAVMTWEWPNTYGDPVVWPEDISFEAIATRVLRESAEKVLGPERADEVELTVLEGPAVLVLDDESARAALLVVGSRGHGEFAGMLIGSVSEFLATHSHCPVVIVRGGA